MLFDVAISFNDWDNACSEPYGKRQVDVNIAHAAALGDENDEWMFWARRISAALREGRYETRH